MKKTQRVGSLIKILSDSPNQPFGLKIFCEMFGAAKSSISEDIAAVKEVMKEMDLGRIETTPGAAGGVKFVPYISNQDTLKLQNELCEKLDDPHRILGGGFIYSSDLMFDPHLVKRLATVFARKFQDLNADIVATIETKGIPVAVMTAYLLNLPLVVIRREAKISEGSTVSINYFSGSYDRVQKMSISKRAVKPGTKALIIDDFMRGGGSIKGIGDILSEFDISVLGTGVVIASSEPTNKKIQDYVPIIFMNDLADEEKEHSFFPNNQIF